MAPDQYIQPGIPAWSKVFVDEITKPFANAADFIQHIREHPTLGMNPSALAIAKATAQLIEAKTSEKRYIDEKKVAQKFAVSRSWLAKKRCYGDGPPFIKLGGKVLYEESELETWLESQRAKPSNEIKGRPDLKGLPPAKKGQPRNLLNI